MKWKIVWRIIFSFLILVSTLTALYLTKLFLNFELVAMGDVKLLTQILIFTFGVFWVFAWTPFSIRQKIYSTLGIIVIIIALISMAHASQINIPVLDQILNNSFLTKFNVIEAVMLSFSGVFFMAYGYIAIEEYKIKK
jgi:hypothetical protein